MGARPQRTDDELRVASGHLKYEIDMLMATAQLLASNQHTGTPLGYALLESFVAHARALLHCFYPPAPGKGRIDNDDVLADDFFDNTGTWDQICPALPSELVGVRERVNKQLAHLTYTRAKFIGADKDWPFLKITAAFLPTFRAFAQAAPAARLATDRWDHIR